MNMSRRRKSYWAASAPHAVTDRNKLAKMIKTLRRGEELPPILTDGEECYEGSHRLAAYEVYNTYARAEAKPRLVVVDNTDLDLSARIMGYEDATDADGHVQWRDEEAVTAIWAAINLRARKRLRAEIIRDDIERCKKNLENAQTYTVVDGSICSHGEDANGFSVATEVDGEIVATLIPTREMAYVIADALSAAKEAAAKGASKKGEIK